MLSPSSPIFYMITAVGLFIISDIANAAPPLSSIYQRQLSNSAIQRRDCLPNGSDVAKQINDLFTQGGEGTVVSLCPNTIYDIYETVTFTAANQELSTQGYPMDDSRATLKVAGAINATGYGMSTAVEGNCNSCNGIKLRHVQIDGNRQGAPVLDSGANIEFGGATYGQLIEFVGSHNPRGWSCLHVFEGSDNCSGAIVHNNDIGPAGTSATDEWADGISYACRNGLVQYNTVIGATDGGIVVFAAPGSLIQNNIVQVGNYTQLGGINLVDNAFEGQYAGTVITNNTIIGGSANTPVNRNGLGISSTDAIIKIGLAMGYSTWFGETSNDMTLVGATVSNNSFQGAFGYAMAIENVASFTVEGNIAYSDAVFVGVATSGCPSLLPSSQAFIANFANITGSVIQSDFTNVNTTNDAICIEAPPLDADLFPEINRK